MSNKTQCDKCGEQINTPGHMTPVASPFVSEEEARTRDGWMHVLVSVTRRYKDEQPPNRTLISGPMGDGEIVSQPAAPAPTQLAVVGSSIDLCPKCSASFIEALGEAGEKIKTEAPTPYWMPSAPVIPLRVVPPAPTPTPGGEG